MRAVSPTLLETLNYQPVPLKFGTSGRRGLVLDLTQLEVYINATAELEYLQSLPKDQGGIVRGDEFYFACDLRPSSTALVQSRGAIAQSVARAVADAGMEPVYLGAIPTPALASFALIRGRGSMMITGSHIPFDRNGYKTNSSVGELLKRDEGPIQARSEQVRAKLYAQPAGESLFEPDGTLRGRQSGLPPALSQAAEDYLRRYTDFFAGQSLCGMRLLVYQHSAVGRDLLVELLKRSGAEVIPAGRSETFVPIDTEAIDAAQLQVIQELAIAAWRQHGPIHAVVSTDGDSDRPLILGVEPATGEGAPCRVRFYGGDLVGMIVAEFLSADAVVVPISCNDALDLGPLKDVVEPKTKIGSPFVIDGMQKAVAAGRKAVCGWEANGGFLLGSNLECNGRRLAALPTRDAFLPILSVLLRARAEKSPVSSLFDRLPRRFSRAALLKNFPLAISRRIVARFSPANGGLVNVSFTTESVTPELEKIRAELRKFFTPELGFGGITGLNFTDGLRVYFENGDVAHLRPSGNADELRIYAVSGSQSRADAITQEGVTEPDGILRRMEKAVRADMAGEALENYRRAPHPIMLEGVVQHYSWGGRNFIPFLLGREELSGKPCAELWLVSHPQAPSLAVLNGVKVPLTELLAAAGERVLGLDSMAKYGAQLPYLFKVLDARQMLSIQAHPSLAQAREGFEREEKSGLSLNASNRNYKDRNHKPEVHVALREFWMLHGFRPMDEIATVMNQVPEFRSLMPEFGLLLAGTQSDTEAQKALLRTLYQRIMTLSQADVDAVLNPLIERLEQQGCRNKAHPDFWALRAGKEFPLPGGHRDRGIFSIYLLNLVHLQPVEATYQPAGTLHAYLEGVNVELMANSDNVLRGGLTPKHVDVPELLQILDFHSGRPEVMRRQGLLSSESHYHTPTEEFELSRIQLDGITSSWPVHGNGAKILIVLDGRCVLRWAGGTLALRRGQAVLVPDDCKCQLEKQASATVLFKAALGYQPQFQGEIFLPSNQRHNLQ